MGLRKGQKELVEQYRGGYCAVPAIPGGGKTHCLSLWAVNMIAEGLHKPGKILIVTYMNSAVNNIKQRIEAELANRSITGSKDYFVSTIHGLCLQIIKEKPDVIGANEDFEIADNITKYDSVNSAIDEWRRKNESRFRLFIDDEHMNGSNEARSLKMWQDRLSNIVLSSIGDFKSRGIDALSAKEICKELPDDSILKLTSEIYELYDRKLKIEGLLDFDDMLYNAKSLLEKDEILLEKYRNKYTFVCEDEAQDSNLIQSEILSMIADGNLLRVGDSNQAICGSFSNSDFSLFKNFCLKPDTTVYNITQSSRNTRDIIDLANYFVKHVRANHPVMECRESLLPQFIEPVGKEDERQNPITDEYGIKYRIFESWEEEARSIVKQAEYMTRVHPDKTIAILIPSSWRINDVVNIMDSWGMKYEELDNNSNERNRVLKVLGRVLDFVTEPDSNIKFTNMMIECFLENEFQMALSQQAEFRQQKENLKVFLISSDIVDLLYPESGITALDTAPEGLSDTFIWKEFKKHLPFVREILDYPLLPYERFILYLADKLDFSKEERAVAQKIAADVMFAASKEKFFSLKGLANELLEPRNSFSYYTGIIWDLKGYEPKKGVVTVSTYHKSKGLEWDIVFLTGLNYADFPVLLTDKFIGEYWFLKEKYKNPTALAKAEMIKIADGMNTDDSFRKSKLETISERTRLLYVGITRARQHLFLSGFHANKGKKNETLPSKYLVELGKYIDMKMHQGR